MKMKTRKNSGFTLIELLIVIGLLGALTAIILPSLTADREEALGSVCDYNQFGTVRTLRLYKQLTGVFPDDMHNGLDGTATGAAAMGGLPSAQAYNMTANDPDDMDGDGATDDGVYVEHALTQNEADSLIAAGIDSICSGTGLNRTPVAAGVCVACCTAAWLDDTPAEYSFDGIPVSDWISGASPDGKAGTIVVLWIAPTVNWDSAVGDNKDWGNGNIELGIDLEGQCPVPVNAQDPSSDLNFAYYMAYFKAYTDGSKAILVGTSCPECGVINP